MERSIKKLSGSIFWIALGALCSLALGQEVGLPNSSLTSVSDQLPARRSFPPVPINDLRNAPARQADSTLFGTPQPSTAPQSFGAAPSIPDLNSEAGNTSGSFLTPISPEKNSNFGSAPPVTVPSRNLPLPSENPLAAPMPKDLPFSALNPSGTNFGGSRPVELVADSTIVDSQVKPASGYAPINGVISSSANETNRLRGLGPAELARQQLERYRFSQANEPLPGQPLKLEDLLSSIPPDRRRAVVRQYWNAFGAWASYLDCCEQCKFLEMIGTSSEPQQRKLLEATKMRANDDRLRAEIALQQAQSELQRLLPSAGSDLLPLPADQPLVEVYETHSDWYIANGQLPANLRTVARTLSLQQKLICQRAFTAQTATENSEAAGQAHEAMQCDLITLLTDIQLSSDCRQAFLQSVVDYNQAIADYSLGIAPANQPASMIASMLVAPTIKATSDTRSVLAEAAARPGDRWAGTQSQPRSIRTMPSDSAEFTAPRQPNSTMDRDVSGSFAPKAMNAAPGSALVSPSTPNFGPPPASGFGAAPPSSLPPAASPELSTGSTNNPAPLAPTSGDPNGFALPPAPPLPTAAAQPVTTGNPAGSFTPPPASSPNFGPASPPAVDKSPGNQPPAAAPAGGTQFKLGG